MIVFYFSSSPYTIPLSNRAAYLIMNETEIIAYFECRLILIQIFKYMLD